MIPSGKFCSTIQLRALKLVVFRRTLKLSQRRSVLGHGVRGDKCAEVKPGAVECPPLGVSPDSGMFSLFFENLVMGLVVDPRMHAYAVR